MKNLKAPLAGLLLACIIAGCKKTDTLSVNENQVTGSAEVSMLATSSTAPFILSTTGGKKVSNIIKPNTGDFWYNSNDFNQAFGLNPGDTVVLKAGTYGHIDITKIDGITFINEGQVIIDSWNFNESAKNVRLLGNGTASIKYGIKINGSTNFATRWYATGNLEIANIEVAGSRMGFQVKGEPGVTYATNNQKLWIHDCYLHDTYYEAFYIGSDELGGPWIDSRIENNIVKNIGRDGIQTRNGYFEILNNTIDQIGLNNNSGHTHAILVGGNTKNSIIRGNTVSNTPYGFGVFINGYGTHTVECNTISSGLAAVFTKNYENQEDLQHVGYQTFDVRNNTLSSSANKSVESYYVNNGIKVSLNYTGNKTANPTYIEPGIIITQSNNGSTVVPVCGTVTPAPTPTPTPTNQSPTVNAGADKTIILPTNSITLSGTASDPDGSIVSYSWAKISGPSAVINAINSASTSVTNLIQGTYTFELTVTDNKGAVSKDAVNVTVNSAVVTVPPVTSTTTIHKEAESYNAMRGVYAMTYRDGVNYIGGIETGDWIDYDVNIPTAGTYTFKFRFATPYTTRTLQVRNSSGTVLSTVSITGTGWGQWTTTTKAITLPAGNQRLRIYANSDTWDLDYFEIAK